MSEIRTHRDLLVYQRLLAAALAASALAARFPDTERALKDQFRRAARSPGASVAEAWRKRRYRAFWVNKLSDAQAEAGEAQYWLEIAWREGYCTEAEFQSLFAEWEGAIGQLSSMIANPAKWNTSGKPQ